MSTSDPINHLWSTWYYCEASDVLYSPNQYLSLDFFATVYSKTALENLLWGILLRFLLVSAPFTLYLSKIEYIKGFSDMYLDISIEKTGHTALNHSLQEF